MIVLLPPSETKRTGGDGPAVRLDNLKLAATHSAARVALIGELVELAADPPACRNALGISAGQDAEIERNAALRDAPTMPAIERYTGVLYDALDVGSLRGTAATRARGRLAVGSALFGLLRADDHVPAYRLSASSKLPGQPSLAKRWRPLLEPVLADLSARELIVGPSLRLLRGVGPHPRRRPRAGSRPNAPTVTAPWSATSTRPTRVIWRGRWPAPGPNRTMPPP